MGLGFGPSLKEVKAATEALPNSTGTRAHLDGKLLAPGDTTTPLPTWRRAGRAPFTVVG